MIPALRTDYQVFVGIDIAAKSVTVAWQRHDGRERAPFTVNQSPAGIDGLLKALQQTGVTPAHTLVAMEATGSYWIALATRLHEAGYLVSVTNPAQVHHYAQSRGRRAKTDAIDAKTLVEFARERRPAAWSPPPAVSHELRQRLVARELLLTMRQQARNHHHALLQWPVIVASVQTQLETTISSLDDQIEALDGEIAQVLADGAWSASAQLLQTIPGIGPVTTCWFLVTTLNGTLGQSAEEVSAYVGLAPMPHQSGTSVRGRASIGHDGSGRLRTALYLATLSAAQSNPIIKAFYDRLRAAGKPHKVARCAAARKLLHLAWAVVAKQQPFDPASNSKATVALVGTLPT